MNYRIIEDCSPYYVSFTFEGLTDIIDFAKTRPTELIRQCPGFSHNHYSIKDADTIISMLPMSDVVTMQNQRAAVFHTPPEGGCGIHKDGIENKVSFNIPLEILDDKCLTHWYTDEEVNELPPNPLGGYARIVWRDWQDLDRFNPVKSMIARPNEMVLFNTAIYHCWTNKSVNTRDMLTLRLIDRSLYFEEIRNLIFGF